MFKTSANYMYEHFAKKQNPLNFALTSTLIVQNPYRVVSNYCRF